MIGEPNRKKGHKRTRGRSAMRPIPMSFRDLCYVFLVFALPGGVLTPAQAQTFGVPTTAPAPDPTAVPIKLLVVIYDPIIESSGGERLHQALGWQDPDVLTTDLIDDFALVSHGVAKYEIMQLIFIYDFSLH